MSLSTLSDDPNERILHVFYPHECTVPFNSDSVSGSNSTGGGGGSASGGARGNGRRYESASGPNLRHLVGPCIGLLKQLVAVAALAVISLIEAVIMHAGELERGHFGCYYIVSMKGDLWPSPAVGPFQSPFSHQSHALYCLPRTLNQLNNNSSSRDVAALDVAYRVQCIIAATTWMLGPRIEYC